MNRRTLLKRVAGAAVTGTALSTTAASRPTETSRASHVERQSRYATFPAVRDAFEAHASELVERLDRNDVLASGDLAELDAFRTAGVDVSDSDGIEVTSTVDDRTGAETAVVRVTETTANAEVDLFVLPGAERSYATVDPDDGEKWLLSPDDDEASTQADEHKYHGDWEFLRTESTCTDDNCDGGNSDCGGDDPLWYCRWDYFTEETYEVYECGRVDVFPDGSTEECGATRRELVNTNCSSNCCTQDGTACGPCGQC